MDKINKTIMIVGTLGSGKSSVGKRLSSYFGVPFKDSDTEVEKAADCTVKDFFEIYGEGSFRDCERKVIKRLLEGEVCILSSGGGSFLCEETRKLAKEKAVTIWLRAGEETLFSRLRGRKRRPQIPEDDAALKQKITQFMRDETPYYALADIKVESLNEPTSATANKVILALEDFLKKHPDN